MSEHEPRGSPTEPTREPTRGPTARLLLSAPDRPGLVASIAEFIYRNGGDVTEADQHTDEEEEMFFQRVEFRLAGFKLSREELSQALAEVAAPLKMKWSVRYSDEDRRVAVLARASLIAWSTCWAAGTPTSSPAGPCSWPPTTATTPS